VIFRDARAVIADRNLGTRRPTIDRNLDRRLLIGVANGVSDHVVERAPDQGGIAPHGAGSIRRELDPSSGGGCLKGGIIDHLVEEITEIESHGFGVRCPGLKAFQKEKLADEVVEPTGLALDAIEGLNGLDALTVAGQLQGYRKTCQRRAQFVRDVSQKAPLRPDQIFEATGHGVEVTRELSDLVGPPIDGIADPRREVAGAETQGRPAQCSDRRRQVAGKPQAEGADNQSQQQESPPQGLGFEEIDRTWRPMEGSDNDQRTTLRIGHGPCHHVHASATHGFLGPTFHHPERQINNRFRNIPVQEVSSFGIKDVNL